MRYKIKFSNGKITILKFRDYNHAQWYLEKILKYKMIDYKFVKYNIEAQIIAQNGIPF